MMTFDDSRWNLNAKQGDVAGIAISTQLALHALSVALMKIQEKASVDVSEEVETITTCTQQLNTLFKDMTGYSDDG